MPHRSDKANASPRNHTTPHRSPFIGVTNARARGQSVFCLYAANAAQRMLPNPGPDHIELPCDFRGGTGLRRAPLDEAAADMAAGQAAQCSAVHEPIRPRAETVGGLPQHQGLCGEQLGRAAYKEGRIGCPSRCRVSSCGQCNRCHAASDMKTLLRCITCSGLTPEC